MFSYDRDNVARADGGPADDAYMITPSDGDNLPIAIRSIRCATAGDLVVTNRAGTNRTITVIAGELIPCGILKVFATGTTATGLLGYV